MSTTPEVLPLRALRFARPSANPGHRLAPPYDVISHAERARLAAQDEHNIVRLELPIASDGTSPYEAARRTLTAWRGEGVLALDPEASVYVHEHDFAVPSGRAVQRSLIARVRLDDSGRLVRPHERTLDGPRRDRLELLRALRTQVSPILGVFHSAEARFSDGLVPVLDARTGEASHRLWRAEKPAAALAAIAGPIYIADGHHRYATALAYRDERRAATPGWTGHEPEEFVLMELLAAEDALLLPWHRIVTREAAPADALERLATVFTLEPLAATVTDDLRADVRLLDTGDDDAAFVLLGPGPGIAHLLRPRATADLVGRMPSGHCAAWRGLDVALLSTALDVALGIDAALVRAGALRYTHRADEAAREVATGAAGLAFLIRPTRIEQMLAVSDASDHMPPKSTYFHPKAPTGLVLYPFDC